VSSSNHAMAWHALRLAGIEDRLPQFGSLFTLPLRD
jgi:maleate isomerase